MHDQSSTIADFLDAAAAKRPTPGGGAVAALAGALAAATGEMVLQYSVDKKELAPYAAANGEALAELTRARGVLLALMAEDQAVFQELTAAKKAGGRRKPSSRPVSPCRGRSAQRRWRFSTWPCASRRRATST